MKTIIGAALIGTGLAAAAMSLVAPAHAESAAITIGQLEAQGFDVKLDRDFIPVVVKRTITVSLDCSR